MIFQAAIAAIALSVLAAGMYLGWQGRKFIDRIEHLEQIAKRQRLPYGVADGVEDTTAIVNDIRFQNGDTDKIITALLTALDKSEAVRAYTDKRLAQVQNRLHGIRNNPHAYDSDTPNQKQEIL